jgi:hypothetical protein
VILDVSRPEQRLRIVVFLEFTKKVFIEFIKDVYLYIKAPPVRHSHYDLAATCPPGIS